MKYIVITKGPFKDWKFIAYIYKFDELERCFMFNDFEQINEEIANLDNRK